MKNTKVHYHAWIYADNGTEFPHALLKRARAYRTRQHAYREVENHYHGGIVQQCKCPTGERKCAK